MNAIELALFAATWAAMTLTVVGSRRLRHRVETLEMIVTGQQRVSSNGTKEERP